MITGIAGLLVIIQKLWNEPMDSKASAVDLTEYRTSVWPNVETGELNHESGIRVILIRIPLIAKKVRKHKLSFRMTKECNQH